MKQQFIMVLLCASFFVFLSVLFFVMSTHAMWLDVRVTHFIQLLICPNLTDIMIKVTNFGSAVGILIVLIIMLLVSFRHAKFFFYVKMLFLTLLVSVVLNVIVKEIVCRPRPTFFQLISENGYSFPSGHSMVSMAFYGFLIFMICSFFQGWKKNLFSFLFGFLIFLIGFSRIYLGVHYFTDVIGGFLLGLVVLSIMMFYTKKYAVLEQKN